MTTQTAYVSTHPDVYAAVLADQEQERTWRALLDQIVTDTPGASDVYLARFLGSRHILGIGLTNPDTTPPGWRWLKTKGYAVPRTGEPGREARERIAAIKAAAPLLIEVLGRVGAPTAVATGPARTGTNVSTPQMFTHDGAVHVLYPVEPTVDNTKVWAGRHKGAPDGRWEREPLSAYYAALETAEAARLSGSPS